MKIFAGNNEQKVLTLRTLSETETTYDASVYIHSEYEDKEFSVNDVITTVFANVEDIDRFITNLTAYKNDVIKLMEEQNEEKA